MGLLDRKEIFTYVEGQVSLEELYELLKEKLGSKYEVKFLKKGSGMAQFLGTGNANDRIFVAKNAYHRTFIMSNQIPGYDGSAPEVTNLFFDRSTIKGWLKILYSQGGWIGQWIIRSIYGSNEPFDNEILLAINSKYPVKQEERNTGISALWKKD